MGNFIYSHHRAQHGSEFTTTMTTTQLSPSQAQALLAILSHHEAYQEIRDLRFPGALSRSGSPFKTNGEPNEMPLLHGLFSSFFCSSARPTGCNARFLSGQVSRDY